MFGSFNLGSIFFDPILVRLMCEDDIFLFAFACRFWERDLVPESQFLVEDLFTKVILVKDPYLDKF